MHVSVAPVSLSRNCCAHLRAEFVSSSNLAEYLRAARKTVFIKASAGSIGNKSARTTGIPGVAPEYLAAGMHTVLNHLPSEATSSRIS